MSEAKRRGSAEQRTAQATFERPLAEVLAELGLPTDTRFKGYVVVTYAGPHPEGHFIRNCVCPNAAP